jgi:hypothetical protein
MSVRIPKDIFWACTLLFVAQLATTPFSSGGTLWDVVTLITGGLSLVPLYGYAYQVAIGNKAIAIVIFGYNAIFLAIVLLFAIHALINNWSLFVLFLVFLLLAVSFAFVYPQYKYAFDSDDLCGASE